MKRFITIIFSLFLISGLFAFEGLSKNHILKMVMLLEFIRLINLNILRAMNFMFSLHQIILKNTLHGVLII